MKAVLDRLVHHPRTEMVLVGLILLSVMFLLIEFLAREAGQEALVAEWLGHLLTGVFIVELAIRFWIAPRKSRFFKLYWLDLLAVLPYTRVLRCLRVLRLFRVGVLLNRRFGATSQSFAEGLASQLGVFLVIGAAMLIGALGLHQWEGPQNEAFRSVSGSLWWSVMTMASGQPVGGEARTEVGRWITLLVLFGSMTLMATLTAVLSAVMVNRLKLGMEVQDVGLNDLREHVVICGWNRAAPLLIAELQRDAELLRRGIVVVAELEALPEVDLRKLNRSRLYFHHGDYTRVDVLEEAGIRHARRAILMADKCVHRSDQDRDARTILAALTIEKLNPTIITCAQLLDRKNNVQLQVAHGVEQVVVDDEVTGQLMAASARDQNLASLVEELLAFHAGNDLHTLPVPAAWEKLTFLEAARRLKEQHQALLVGLDRAVDGNRKLLVNPPADTVLVASDALVCIAQERPRL